MCNEPGFPARFLPRVFVHGVTCLGDFAVKPWSPAPGSQSLTVSLQSDSLTVSPPSWNYWCPCCCWWERKQYKTQLRKLCLVLSGLLAKIWFLIPNTTDTLPGQIFFTKNTQYNEPYVCWAITYLTIITLVCKLPTVRSPQVLLCLHLSLGAVVRREAEADPHKRWFGGEGR